MRQITFSVIVPVYNVEDYLCQCVDSILSQDNCDLEVILVDDGSTDSSGKICDEYANKNDRIHVIHKENGGLSDARNVGVHKATGEYLLFIDSDDYIADQSIQDIALVIAENNCPDLVFLECFKMYTDIHRMVPMNDGVTEEINMKRDAALKEYIAELPKYPASACSKAVSRKFFCDNNLYFKKGILCEDLEWAVRLFLVMHTAAYCSTSYYYYRQNRMGSISNSPNSKMAMDVLGIVDQCRQLAEAQNDYASGYMVRSIMEYIFRFLCIHTLKVARKDHKEYIRCVKSYDDVIGTRKDGASRKCALAYRLFGVEITGWLLRGYLWLREKNG